MLSDSPKQFLSISNQSVTYRTIELLQKQYPSVLAADCVRTSRWAIYVKRSISTCICPNLMRTYCAAFRTRFSNRLRIRFIPYRLFIFKFLSITHSSKAAIVLKRWLLRCASNLLASFAIDCWHVLDCRQLLVMKLEKSRNGSYVTRHGWYLFLLSAHTSIV